MNRLTAALLATYLVTLLGACADEAELDDVDDGKGDVAAVPRPIGTFRRDAPGNGLLSITLTAERTFSLEQVVMCFRAPCNPVRVNGTFRFTKSGERRFIRLYDEAHDFLDRYEYVLDGSVLELRDDGGDDWLTLRRFAGGEIEPSTSYIASTDGMECAMPSVHCVTNDFTACPQLSPLPPDFCANGEVQHGEPNYISSADGMECAMPSVHCVTKDSHACPQLSPLPPDYCAGGEVQRGATNFVSSSDGMECALPEIHCVTKSRDACPLLSPLPPDFCPAG